MRNRYIKIGSMAYKETVQTVLGLLFSCFFVEICHCLQDPTVAKRKARPSKRVGNRKGESFQHKSKKSSWTRFSN